MELLDQTTRRQLGFDEVWSQIVPLSPLGRTYMRRTKAFAPGNWVALEAEFERLERICADLTKDAKVADDLGFLLRSARDISGTLQRSLEGVTLDEIEFYEVKKLLGLAEKIHLELERLGWHSLLPQPLDLCSECRDALSLGQGSSESFYLADAYSPRLAQIRSQRVECETILARYREHFDGELLQIAGRVLSADGEITVSTQDAVLIHQLEALPGLGKVQESQHFVTFRLQEEATILQVREELGKARGAEERCKNEVRKELTALVGEFAPRLLELLESLAALDFLLAKARFGAQIGGVRPRLSDDGTIRIRDGRHLLVEEEVRQAGQRYTPLSMQVGPGVTLITGPNMGGKTATLKTLGLLMAMAQYGLLVPATAMEFRPRQLIRSHLATAEIPQGLSTFAGEVVFFRDVINYCDEEALILVDEIAHGTNPLEGAAIAQAILEFLRGKRAITVVTTHFPSLARLEGLCHLRVKGLEREKLRDLEVGSLQRYMDYRLEVVLEGQGQIQTSDAAIVAEALGLQGPIVQRAKELTDQELL